LDFGRDGLRLSRNGAREFGDLYSRVCGKSEGAKQVTTHGGKRVHWGDIRRIQKEGRSKTFYIGSGSGGGRRNCGKRDDG